MNTKPWIPFPPVTDADLLRMIRNLIAEGQEEFIGAAIERLMQKKCIPIERGEMLRDWINSMITSCDQIQMHIVTGQIWIKEQRIYLSDGAMRVWRVMWLRRLIDYCESEDKNGVGSPVFTPIEHLDGLHYLSLDKPAEPVPEPELSSSKVGFATGILCGIFLLAICVIITLRMSGLYVVLEPLK